MTTRFLKYRIMTAVTSAAILLTFDKSSLIGSLYPHLTEHKGMLYIPIAGLIFYGLAWLTVIALVSTMADGRVLLGLLGIPLGILILPLGWFGHWFAPASVPHTVKHLLFGNFVFPADPVMSVWVVAGITLILYLMLSHYEDRRVVQFRIPFKASLVVVLTVFTTLLPQIIFHIEALWIAGASITVGWLMGFFDNAGRVPDSLKKCSNCGSKEHAAKNCPHPNRY